MAACGVASIEFCRLESLRWNNVQFDRTLLDRELKVLIASHSWHIHVSITALHGKSDICRCDIIFNSSIKRSRFETTFVRLMRSTYRLLSCRSNCLIFFFHCSFSILMHHIHTAILFSYRQISQSTPLAKNTSSKTAQCAMTYCFTWKAMSFSCRLVWLDYVMFRDTRIYSNPMLTIPYMSESLKINSFFGNHLNFYLVFSWGNYSVNKKHTIKP